VRVDEVDEDLLEDAGDQIERAFASRARLSELGGAAELLDARLSVAATLRLEQELEPRPGRNAVVAAQVHLDEGTNSTVDATPRVLDVVASLDGSTRLGDLVQAAADRLELSDAQTSRLRHEVLDAVRELLELGALRFH
jgi:hypothetical protein